MCGWISFASVYRPCCCVWKTGRPGGPGEPWSPTGPLSPCGPCSPGGPAYWVKAQLEDTIISICATCNFTHVHSNIYDIIIYNTNIIHINFYFLKFKLNSNVTNFISFISSHYYFAHVLWIISIGWLLDCFPAFNQLTYWRPRPIRSWWNQFSCVTSDSLKHKLDVSLTALGGDRFTCHFNMSFEHKYQMWLDEITCWM